tara:strand:- start:9 stop:302 length:294 start_codon:yes stop_codon:yes gene_type:complete
MTIIKIFASGDKLFSSNCLIAQQKNSREIDSRLFSSSRLWCTFVFPSFIELEKDQQYKQSNCDAVRHKVALDEKQGRGHCSDPFDDAVGCEHVVLDE